MASDTTTPPELMTVAEVAKLWRQRPETVYRKLRSGQLRGVRLGDGTSALRIPRREVERIYEMSAVGGGSSAEDAVGHSSSVGAGGTSPPRPLTPAAHARDPEALGSRTRTRSAGEGR